MAVHFILLFSFPNYSSFLPQETLAMKFLVNCDIIPSLPTNTSPKSDVLKIANSIQLDKL